MKKTGIYIAFFSLLFLLSSAIDSNDLFNYENQFIPDYITKDNTESNFISDEGATLGRVLFYDKMLSTNKSVACASCHLQERAFGDTARQSIGVNGLTERHSMRLINSRFGKETRFFWDRRANSLEEQTIVPIKDHLEMGFSGNNGDQGIEELIALMSETDYYPELFDMAFGDPLISETGIQLALAQFIRSIQSFDSRFDEGYAQVGGDPLIDFPNFTNIENKGKKLYVSGFESDIVGEGFRCVQCHVLPEFSIVDEGTFSVGNNGVISVIGSPNEVDLSNNRSPSLRDVVNPDGTLNTPLMHDGSINTLGGLMAHYSTVGPAQNNPELDIRLQNGPLQIPQDEKLAVIAFLKTLTGVNVYTDEKWSDPFNEDGSLSLFDLVGFHENKHIQNVSYYPNPVINDFNIEIKNTNTEFVLSILSIDGQQILSKKIGARTKLDLRHLSNGIYVLKIKDLNSMKTFKAKFIKS